MRRSFKPTSVPLVESARAAVVLNCQIPWSSDAYSVVPSAEKLMVSDELTKLV